MRNLKLPLLLILFFTASSAFAAQQVGQVVDLKGEVLITPKGAAPQTPQFKQAIFLGDTLQTKATGSIKVLFVDDTVLTIKENSKTLITQFLFNPKKNVRKGVFDVAFGKVRTVVGKFYGEDQPVEVKTPTAVAGIRGTDVGLDVTPKKTAIYVFDGRVTAYNIDFPDKAVEVEKGFAINVVEGAPTEPENIMTIPPAVMETREVQFDISMKSTGAKETPSAVQQAAVSVTGTVATETAQESAPAAAEEAAPASTTMEAASESQASESDAVAASPDSGETTTQPLPNAESESTTETATSDSTTITITFPE